MTTHTASISPLTIARVAASLYLSLAPLVFFGFPYGLPRLFVPEDAATTAKNIIASESLLLLSIVVNLVGFIVNIFAVLTLYRLLKPVSKAMTALMVVFLLLSVPIGIFNELNHIAALLLLSGANYLKIFTTEWLQSLAYLFLRLHTQGSNIAYIFWGLWLFPWVTWFSSRVSSPEFCAAY